MPKVLRFLKRSIPAGLLAMLLFACQSESSLSVDAEQKDRLPTVRIEFWHAMYDEPKRTLEEIAEKYNSMQTSVQVKPINQGNYTTLQQKLMAAAKTGTTPALSQTFMDWNAVFAEHGLVVDLTSFIRDAKSGWSQEELDDIYPVFRMENRIDGKLYSLPFNKSAALLFYNKTLLDKHDVAVPTTWEEMQDAARKLTMEKPGGAGSIVGMGFENSLYSELQNYVVQAGGEYIRLEETPPKMVFHSPEGVEAVGFLREMFDSGTARLAGEDGYMSGPFSRGDVAMFIGSSAGISFVADGVDSGFEWFAAVPPKGKQAVAHISGTNISMFSTANEEQRRAAWHFLTYLLNTENSALWARRTGYLPVRESANDLESYRQFIEDYPVQGVAVQQLKAGKALTRVPGALTVEPLIAAELEAMLLGKKDIEQGLADAELAANTELARLADSQSFSKLE